MEIPAELYYTDDHEWIDTTSGIAKIGITAYAADALGDVVFVQLPQEGTTVEPGDLCGEVESTKSVSEIYAPAGGVVKAVNAAVIADPGMLNADPYGEGWLYQLEITQTKPLLSPDDYARYIRVGHLDQGI